MSTKQRKGTSVGLVEIQDIMMCPVGNHPLNTGFQSNETEAVKWAEKHNNIQIELMEFHDVLGHYKLQDLKSEEEQAQ